jgi:hypothetical protein
VNMEVGHGAAVVLNSTLSAPSPQETAGEKVNCM